MNNRMVLIGPPDTKSGYGYRSRDLFRAIIELYSDEYDIQVVSRRWGATPRGSLNYENPNDKLIMDRLIGEESIMQGGKPDVTVQVSVPNEFQEYGNFNIGVTAGIETNACSMPWIEGLNRMDLNLVSSEHSKNVLTNTAFTSENKQHVLKNIKPTEVLFEGYDPNIFKVLKKDSNKTEITKTIDDLKEDFIYLTVGHWLAGEFSQDRKNIGMTIYTFFETFKSLDDKPALLLKTAAQGYSTTDKIEIEKRINEIKHMFPEDQRDNLPNVYLLYGDLTDSEMNELYNHRKIKSMYLLTRGEGYGRPFLEFGVTGKPIITSGWSGHLDFLKSDEHVLIGGQLQPVHKSAQWKDVIIDGSSWFTADFKQSLGGLLYVHQDYKKALMNAKKGKNRIDNEFTFNKMKTRIKHLFHKYIPNKDEVFELPTLQKL